jgi:O-antigen ligase
VTPDPLPTLPAGARVPDAARRLLLGLTVLAVTAVSFSVFLSSVAMSSAFLIWLWYLVTRRGDAFPRTDLDIFFLFYLAAEAIATAFSGEPWASFVNMKRFFLIAYVYLILISVSSRKDLLLAVAVPVGAAALFSCVELLSLTSAGGHYARLSLFQYFLTEGGIKMMLLLLIVPFMMHGATPRRWRVAAVFCSVPLAAGILLTQSRSAWLGLVAGILTIALLQNRKLILLLVLLIVLFLLFAPADFQARARSIFDPAMSSNLSRIHMITTGWRMFLDHPLFGVGDIDLKRLYITYTKPIEEGEGGHLHNNLMMLLVTLGIAGAVASFALFIKILLVELRAVREAATDWLPGSLTIGCLAAYVGFQVNGLFEWNFGDHEIAVLLWFTVGLALLSRTHISQLAAGSAR